MKNYKLFTVVFLFTMMFSVSNAFAFKFWFSWGRYSETTTINEGTGTTTTTKGCSGSAFCGGGGKKITLYTKDNGAMANADMIIKNGKIYVKILTPHSIKEKSFIVDEEYTFDEQSSKKMGFNSVVLKKGTYPIDFSKNKFGVVILDTKLLK